MENSKFIKSKRTHVTPDRVGHFMLLKKDVLCVFLVYHQNCLSYRKNFLPSEAVNFPLYCSRRSTDAPVFVANSRYL